VPTWNGLKLLEKSLPAIADLDYTCYEVIVVDGGSNDGSQDYIRHSFPSFELIELPKNRGVAGNMNAAIPCAEGEYVCFLDNDFIVRADYIKKVLKCFEENPDVGMVGVHIEENGTIYSSGFFGKHAEIVMKRHVGEALYVSGVCMGFRANALREAGGFDSNIRMGSDDVDIAIRLRHLGWRTIALPDVSGFHMRSRTVRRFRAKRSYYVLSARLYMFLKDFTWTTAFRLMAKHTLLQAKTIIVSIRKGAVYEALYVLAAYLSLLSKVKTIIEERRKIKRTVPDSFFLEFRA
jgi:GT2 family glycosyltransferase